jgi:hypothetical protein
MAIHPQKPAPDADPPMSGGGALERGAAGVQDQAILPLSIAFGLCIRGIRSKLGRSLVTLMGVCFGIAFLMSLISSVHLKDALAKQAAAKREVDRTVALARGEVGALKGKRLVLIGARPAAGNRDELYLALHVEQGADLVDLRGIFGTALDQRLREQRAIPADSGASTTTTLPIILVGEADLLIRSITAGTLDGKSLLVFTQPAESTMAKLKSFGVDVAGEVGAETGTHGRVKVLSLALRDEERVREAARIDRERWRTIWVLGASLLLTVIGIANAMLMSVTERFREIGTMKCLGALPHFVVRLFLIESTLLGFAGSVLGCIIGAGFAFVAYGYTYGFSQVVTNMSVPTLLLFAGVSVAVGVALSIIAAIYPARVAASMVPASALASTI